MPFGGGPVVVLYKSSDAFSNPRGLAVDARNGRLFWAQGGALLTSTLQGGNVVVAVARAPDSFVTDIQVDPVAKQMYWADNGTDTIYRADYDCILAAAVPLGVAMPSVPASCIVDAVKLYSNPDAFSNPVGLAIDVDAGLMFWGERHDVMVASITGAQPRVLIPGTADNFPTAASLDRVHRRLFWTDNGSDAVSSVDYTGANLKVLYVNPDRYSNPMGVAVVPGD